ncbi:porin family protein [Neptuniibacter halophilus]|uniref:porin family protein n=1 Tax=Neptuniibacter halophilus TaxID=651666 RepID=UPI0025744071|nr:porin family protein [Neptuniibacter halophilus]
MSVAPWVQADPVTDIQALLDQAEYSRAYQVALQHLDQYEGDPAFDLPYAVAAIDSGHPSEGIFALERVLFLQPNHQLARLELARAYFLLGQMAQARSLFEQVRQSQPPANVISRIDLFLARIDNRERASQTRFSGFAELWAGYDSNINSGPGGQTQLVTLSDSALGRDDQFNLLRLGGRVEHHYSKRGALQFDASSDLRYYHTEPEQDYKRFRVSGGHLWKNSHSQYLLQFSYDKYQLDREDYRDQVGAKLVWSQQLTGRSVIKSFAAINGLDYVDNNWKDATLYTLGSNYFYAADGGWKPLYFMGGFIGAQKPENGGILADGQVDQTFYGVSAGAQFSPSESLRFTPALTYQSSDYQGEDWLYGIKRSDDFLLLNLNMEWRFNPSWSLQANYSFTDVDSNIELYEYDRQQVMLGLRYNFQ